MKTRKHKPQTFSGLSKHIKPGNDFYLHVNQSWLDKTKIPPTKVVYGVSEEIEKKIEGDTQHIIQECIKEAKQEKKTLESMIGTLALSVHHADSSEESINLVRNVLSSIQSVTNKEEVAVILGEFTKYKINTLFHLYGQYENKHKTQYTYTIGIGTLGLPDPSFYLKRSLNRGKYLKAYKQFLKHVGSKFDVPNLHCVVKLERILAGVLYQADRDTFEYERTGKELEDQFYHIPFEVLFNTVGIPHWRQQLFFIDSLRWLHTLNKLFHHLQLDQWKLLLTNEFLLYSLSWLPPPYNDLSFQFYRKLLKGQQEKVKRQEQAIYVVQQYAMPFFSRLYKEKIVDTSVKPHVLAMVSDFLHFAKDRLQNVEWLEPETRKKAQEKVEAMRFIVAFPDEFEHHILPELDKTNVLMNLLELGRWQTEYEIHKLGQPISKRKEWDDALFVVNAYYYEQANEMVIPSGILQAPFYQKDASLALNYGGLGCIICHEMTHAFDKEGKEYDPKGFQKKWWTPQDNRNYNKQTEALVKLYGHQKVLGLPVSGKKTLSENIADIGGMSIALDALNHKIKSMALTEEERKNIYKEFFISYAISWRLKEKKKKRISALIMDKHAPPSLRVNLVVSQFQEWYDAFDVKSEDKLYLAPEKRIHIF